MGSIGRRLTRVKAISTRPSDCNEKWKHLQKINWHRLKLVCTDIEIGRLLRVLFFRLMYARKIYARQAMVSEETDEVKTSVEANNV